MINQKEKTAAITNLVNGIVLDCFPLLGQRNVSRTLYSKNCLNGARILVFLHATYSFS